MNSKIIMGVIGAIILVALGFFLFRGHEEVIPPKNSLVIAFGDSLVQGVGSTEGHDFITLISAKIGTPIINAGQSGDTTETALARIDGVISQEPGLVILLLGGNDYLRRIPKETTFQNLGKIVTVFKQNDIRVLLLGVRGGLLKDTYEGDFAQFAEDNNLPYISNVLDGIIGNKELMADEVHPNDKGYQMIADRVAPRLKELLGTK